MAQNHHNKRYLGHQIKRQLLKPSRICNKLREATNCVFLTLAICYTSTISVNYTTSSRKSIWWHLTTASLHYKLHTLTSLVRVLVAINNSGFSIACLFKFVRKKNFSFTRWVTASTETGYLVSYIPEPSDRRFVGYHG